MTGDPRLPQSAREHLDRQRELDEMPGCLPTWLVVALLAGMVAAGAVLVSWWFPV